MKWSTLDHLDCPSHKNVNFVLKFSDSFDTLYEREQFFIHYFHKVKSSVAISIWPDDEFPTVSKSKWWLENHFHD